ncbi:MAG: M28 family peptidase [Acidobacteria bacterium]|nr:M28 family peptidase [Acidobacteriota bacterium]
MRKITSFVLVAALTVSMSSLAQTKKPKATVAPAPAPGNVEDLTAAQLKSYLTFIASDEMEGRDTPSKGLNITARFIAAMLDRWGVQPAGENGTYFQKINLRRTKLEPEKTVAEINGQSYKYGDDFLATAVPATVSGNCVYVGHGYVIKSKNINAYQTSSGTIDIKDKIIIINSGFPKDVTMRELTGKQGEDWLDPMTYARKNGAKAIVAIPNFLTLANWKNAQRNVQQRGSLLPEMGNDMPAQLPAITLSVPMVNALFAGERTTGITILTRGAAGEMAEPFDLNKKVSFTIGGAVEQIPTQNVIGVLPGSDPVLKNEYVAIGAHYDHVGVGAPDAKGDSIYNGADDDGSGTTAVLALAETFAKGPRPKRSLLFIWHCGEEKGLWGSEYFTNHPTVDLKQVVTQLNIDMIGRSKPAGDTNPRNRELSGPNEIYVIGSKMMSTELGALSERVNNNFLKLEFNYKYDDPRDPNRFFFRSDHFNYAQKGVPIIFYFDGEHEDYHRPSDHVEKIDFQKMEKVSRTVYATAWELGNAATRPKIDKQLPAELSAN